MARRDEPSPSALGRLAAVAAVLGLMAGWVLVLQLDALQPRGVGAGSLFELRSLETARLSLGRILGAGVRDALRCVPLGLLAVFLFRDRASRLVRGLVVAPLAFAAGVVAAGVAVWLRDRAAGPPGPTDLVIPAAGVFLGVLVGLALRRGVFALLLLPLKLALGAALVAAVALALLALAVEGEPSVVPPAPVSTEQKREVARVFRWKNPRKVPDGETRTLQLSEENADRLIAWVLPLALPSDRARVDAAFGEPSGTLALRGSLRLPLGRWLNGQASARATVSDGRLELAEPRLGLGRFELPHALLDASAPLVALAIRSERRLRPVLPAIESLRVEQKALVARYRRMEIPPGMLASLVWGEGESLALRDAVADQVAALLARLPTVPAGDARFGAALEAAFARARERASAEGSNAVDENRGALLALGVVLGHERLSAVVGHVVDSETRARIQSARGGATLRGRADWSRHFALSGALTVLSAVAPSDAAGLFKEELDADGGSGFSFGDLLADRSGTTLAAAATRDEAAAAALQARLAGGFRVDDYFPPAEGLPEGISDVDLRARYGGVGGPLYSKHVEEIERRVAALPAYR
jgi:hypothetical protein